VPKLALVASNVINSTISFESARLHISEQSWPSNRCSIRWIPISRTNVSVIANDSIWNQNYAYAYGLLNANSNGEVLRLEWGKPTC
jgi:hypothetical protein